ncbi:MAG: DNA topoisomerase, partial [Nitrospiraceae bacterium]|nr:DNA topoisomerase [Nitrospiraceae bacterium]
MSVRKKSAPAPSDKPKVRATRKTTVESPKPRSRGKASAEKGPETSPKGTLIIVESPTKARTLTRILGSAYKVKASVGHLKDLPPSRIGVDLDNDYELQFVVSEGKKKVLDEIRQAARGAREIFLASDPDREGEAIAYHIASELTGLKKPIRRVLVHELTPRGIEAALSEPGEIDLHKVDAQKARRALDRIVGYTISPLLWERVRRGLSAGRVQSVAVRLVCDRENEIRSFVPVEYWTITLEMRPSDPARSGSVFTARLDRISGKKAQIGTAAEAQETVDRILSEGFRIASLSADEKRRQPSPPLTTSRLQQEGARRFRFSAKKTMQLAQKLYEGVELPGQGQTGLITYMRTDSV